MKKLIGLFLALVFLFASLPVQAMASYAGRKGTAVRREGTAALPADDAGESGPEEGSPDETEPAQEETPAAAEEPAPGDVEGADEEAPAEDPEGAEALPAEPAAGGESGLTRAAGDTAYAVAGGNIYFHASNGTITSADTAITAAVIPTEIDGVAVVRIGNDAFKNCESLTAVQIPDGVTSIGSAAFSGCKNLSSVNIPKGWTTVGHTNGAIFSGCTSLTSVVVPEGMTALPSYAFTNCETLQTITLPGTLTKIGASAFENCTALEFVYVPHTVDSIGNGAFKNCGKLLLHCELVSMATVYAIDNGMPFIALETVGVPNTGVLSRSASRYFADTNAVNTNGYITLTANIAVANADWASMSSREAVIGLPSVMELEESTIKVDGVICTDYTYRDGKLTVPLAAPAAEIQFSGKVVGQSEIVSYALLSYRANSTTTREIIGVIHEGMEALTLETEEYTSAGKVRVEGVAPKQTMVSLYVDDQLATTVMANKAGTYSSEITLDGDAQTRGFVLKAECAGSGGETLSTSRVVFYRQEMPSLTGFKFFTSSDDSQGIDLFALANKGIAPSVTHTGGKHPYRFEVTFTNAQAIDSLYVTSVRNNVKRSIEAVYDAGSGTFVAIGAFNEGNTAYVPGKLSVEYTLKHEDILVGEEIDWGEYSSYLDDSMQNAEVTNTTENGVSTGTIDFSGVGGAVADIALDYSLKTAGQVDESEFNALLELAKTAENVFSYTVPGTDGSSYHTVLDFRDPAAYNMIVANTASVADTATQFVLSMADETAANYDRLFDAANEISQVSVGVGVLADTFGIITDYEKLRNEIMMSSHITDKTTALNKAKELMYNQMGFMLLTTALPLLVGGGVMAGPTMCFGAMIGAMKIMSGIFWDMHVSQIKGTSYNIKWRIDPSGYVYNAVTGERLAGVTTTAYWIEFDIENGDDSFWENPPADDVYGEVWDAAEYSQQNPLTTDAEGRYAWDVPEGWWRVKYEREGFETTWSEWLPVPPPQTEVNIGMEPKLMAGDVNRDASISLSDAVQAARLAAGLAIPSGEAYGRRAADANEDGEVDVLDVLLICRFIAGKVDSLPQPAA